MIGLLTGLVGIVLGAFGVLAFHLCERQRRERVEVGERVLPEGAAEVLSAIGRAYVIVDVIDGVVRASPAAYAFGLVRGHTVVHKELLELTGRVRRDGVIEERQ
ncbi:two-component sensor histidine kinase, partial [Arthrobacter deserti]|nr:two-component sensor histidine kinase [Arthrobacter deserti]